MSGPNWPTKAGATAAMTRSPWLMDWMTWKIWLLSAMAPKRAVHKAHAAGDALVVVDLRRGPCSSEPMASMPQALAQGRSMLYGWRRRGRRCAHCPHLTHLLWSITLLPCTDGSPRPWAHLHAGMCQAALAHVRHVKRFFRAGVAGEFDDIDEGRLVVLLRPSGLLDTGGKRARARRWGAAADRWTGAGARPRWRAPERYCRGTLLTSPGKILYGSSSTRL